MAHGPSRRGLARRPHAAAALRRRAARRATASPHTRAISATTLDDRGYGGAGGAHETGEVNDMSKTYRRVGDVLKRRRSPTFHATRADGGAADAWFENAPPTRVPLPVPTRPRRRPPMGHVGRSISCSAHWTATDRLTARRTTHVDLPARRPSGVAAAAARAAVPATTGRLRK